MQGKKCDICGNKKFKFTQGMCISCYNKTQDDIDDIAPLTLPDGLVAFWIDKFSYISIKKNQRYFKIPDKLKKNIIEGKYYRIIIREIS